MNARFIAQSLKYAQSFTQRHFWVVFILFLISCGGGAASGDNKLQKLALDIKGLANGNSISILEEKSQQKVDVSKNGVVYFEQGVDTSSYNVSISKNPSYQSCTINSNYQIANNNDKAVEVQCTTNAIHEDQPVKAFASPNQKESTLFTSGESGYAAFRIPAITRTRTGRLLAFAEGRKNGPQDWGDIDIVYKYSDDSGETWSPLKTAISEGEGTWGNPTVVVDQATGFIWLFLNSNSPDYSQRGDKDTCRNGPCLLISKWEDRRVHNMRSTNDGESFENLQDLTEALKPKDMVWDAVGPGNGIQIASSATMPANRLIIPAIYRNIISDDNGLTWSYLPIPLYLSSEGTIVHTKDDTLIRNDRPVGELKTKKVRAVTISTDGGINWSDMVATSQTYNLTDPACEGSSIRFSTKKSGTSRIFFTNANSEMSRWPLTTRLSIDETNSWKNAKLLDDVNTTSSGYSSMTRSIDDHLITLYESENTTDPRNLSIKMNKYNLEWFMTPWLSSVIE